MDAGSNTGDIGAGNNCNVMGEFSGVTLLGIEYRVYSVYYRSD